LRILLDKNVPDGVRRFLPKHEVRSVVQMQWPERLENGELLKRAEESGFDMLVTCDQNIPFQQNLAGRKLALIVLGSNILPLVRQHGDEIAQSVDAAMPGSYRFIEIPLPPKPRQGQRFER
jgi:predicted nuclease of predicted toxin-antitoxin system